MAGLVATNTHTSASAVIDGIFNISEADETIIRSQASPAKARSCFALPLKRQEDLKSQMTVDLQAREAKIAQIEDSINRIRESMSWKSPENSSACARSGMSSTISSSDSTIGTLDLNSHSSESESTRDREVLRQKVREKENALHHYIQRSSDVMDEIRMRRTQVENLVLAMDEKDVLTDKLSKEVARLEKEIEDCQEKARQDMAEQRLTAFDQLDNIEKKVEAKEEQVNYYEFKLQTKDNELLAMREELEEAQSRVIELEVNLETHDIRFASHAEYLRQVDTEALDVATDAVGSARHGATVRAEKYIQKLNADLADMEQRYMQEKTRGLLQIASLEKDNKACRARLVSLARHLAMQNQISENNQNGVISPEASPTAASGSESAFTKFQPNLEYMRKRLELIENENIGQVQKIKDLRAELAAKKDALQEKKEAKDKELAWLQLENQSLTVKIAELEQELRAVNRYPEPKREYSLLEKKLDQSVVEILNLVEQVYAKERTISSLRSKLVDIRIQRSAVDRTAPDRRFSLKSLSKHPGWFEDEEQKSGGTGGTADETESSYVYELQSQLQESQRNLREKDEELRLLRDKSDAQALKLQTKLEPQKTTVPDLYFL